MHPTSIENLQKCINRYLARHPFLDARPLRVLDIGGADVNGSYRRLFASGEADYLTADIDAADGVDIVLNDPYRIPEPDASFDVVISGQMLEHCEFFWLSFQEMMRLVRPDGFLFLIAPSAGPIHRYPVDCYRFYPDAYHALAKYSGCVLVDLWLDERGPWRDLTGVFAKTDIPRYSHPSDAPSPPKPAQPAPGSPEEECTAGTRRYLDVLKFVHETLDPSLYLELGVRDGNSMRLAQCRSIGVDVAPNVPKGLLGQQALVITATSDDFFEFDADTLLDTRIDMVFIDGMHLFEYALRDFINAERRASPCGLIIIDDILPCHPKQASRERQTRVWMGDVWKIKACLEAVRPDLFCLAVDTSPGGLLMVAGIDPDNRRLTERYNPIVRQYWEDEDPPESVLQRSDAVDPSDPRIGSMLTLLKDAKTRNHEPRMIVLQLRELFQEAESA